MIIEIVVCAEIIVVENLVDTSASIATKHLVPKHDRLLVTGVATMVAEGEGICFIRHHDSYKEYNILCLYYGFKNQFTKKNLPESSFVLKSPMVFSSIILIRFS